MAATTEPDLDRRRRDLYAISLGLLLFNLAGGSLGSSTSTLFGTIHLSSPEVLGWGAWAAWVYFLWRFSLAAEPIWGLYLDDVDGEIEHSRRYGAYMQVLFDGYLRLINESNGSNPEWMPDAHSHYMTIYTQAAKDLVASRRRYMLRRRTYAADFIRSRIVSNPGTDLGFGYEIPDKAFELLTAKH
ncbi:hypothetical protein, partial [Dokdonella sp.]|uniref:hypothetical protein n=1 Tax=Dokdonella sp. TaxID=2291710 RepID=UPI003C62166E